MPDSQDTASPFNTRLSLRGASKDKYGNPEGTGFDLAKDGAFKGLKIAVLQLYTGEGFDFRLPADALAEKGFTVRRWTTPPPSAHELCEVLKGCCQLWIISDKTVHLGADHIGVIQEFFNSGRGVYVWGDNSPYFADANDVATSLFDARLSGNVPGDQVVHWQEAPGGSGLVSAHPVCAGLENLYEGVTIATVGPNPLLEPVVYGSAGNLVVAAHDRYKRRALIDGGFTRLFHKWDTAGTGRYVRNAAAWLVNYERFGPAVMGRR